MFQASKEKQSNQYNQKEKSNNYKKEQEIGKALNEHTNELKEIEKKVTIDTEKKKFLQNELQEIFADKKITKKEKEELHTYKALDNDSFQGIIEEFPQLMELGIDEAFFEDVKKLGYKKSDIVRIVKNIISLQKEREGYEEKKSEIISLLQQYKLKDVMNTILEKVSQTEEILEAQDIDMISYIIQQQEKIKKEEYEEFMKKLWKLILQQYIGEKQLEIYEITIDENGNIIIKTKGGKEITIKNSDLQGFSGKFIEKYCKEIFGEKEFQKIKQKIEETKNTKSSEKNTSGSILENFFQNNKNSNI